MIPTILLVDDVRMYLEMQIDYLRDTNTKVLTAADGVDALQIVRTQRPDLVFMDLQMPRMDGAACCKAIKSDPELAAIPVVMVTFKGKNEEEDQGVAAGCDAFLAKPLDRDRFLDLTRRFLPNTDRRGRRIPVRIDAVFNYNDREWPSTIHNVSRDGCFIETDCFGTPGRVVQIAFKLPDGTQIECHAKIVWVNRVAATHPVGFGVRFSMVPREAQGGLDRFILSR